MLPVRDVGVLGGDDHSVLWGDCLFDLPQRAQVLQADRSPETAVLHRPMKVEPGEERQREPEQKTTHRQRRPARCGG